MRKIPEQTLQDLVSYLAERPYKETFQIIAQLLKLEKIEELKVEKTVPNKG